MIWFLFGCEGPEDTGEPAVVEDPAACAVEVAHSGQPVGEESCAEGICEVPAGAFVMGSGDAEDRCPERSVELSAFAIGRFEVLRFEWEACVDAGACEEARLCETEVPNQEEALLPVTCVSWQEAEDYCGWVGGRLPTEAEWEKAVRGQEGALWPWGGSAPSCDNVNYRFVSAYCQGGVVEAGSYLENPRPGSAYDLPVSAYGLADTTGNAWEWTSDWYDAGYYREAPDQDPPGPTEGCRLEPEGEAGACRYKVMRGGAYNSTQDVTRGDARSFADPERWDVNIGFRCAWDR